MFIVTTLILLVVVVVLSVKLVKANRGFKRNPNLKREWGGSGTHWNYKRIGGVNYLFTDNGLKKGQEAASRNPEDCK